MLPVLLLAACSSTSPEPAGAEPPVLLLPGFGGSTSDLALIAAELRADDREVRLVELDEDWPDFETQAALLDDAVGDDSSVDVVGFSAGGLVARLWAAGAGADVARRVVTVATPNHGISPEVLGPDCTGGCASLLAGSDLVTGLNADETPDGVEWTTIWSATDGVVTPASSAQLEGALDVRVQDVCPGLTLDHLQMLGAPVPEMVAVVLAGGEPDASVCEPA
jgi:triacylglycerol lipase